MVKSSSQSDLKSAGGSAADASNTSNAPAGRRLVGRVISSKSSKTAIVRVEQKKMHPRYKKQMRWSKNYPAHDEEQVAKEGYLVEIAECRPYSKTKKFRILSVLEEKSDSDEVVS